ncbi:MAG: ferredoxin--NADP reductase [Chloroflexota bacterium]|nr:ferredoxin--NADP reductase [Chloroflexota bacterium]
MTLEKRAKSAAQPALPKARVVERKDYTPNLMVIKLQPETPYAFKAGHYCTIGVDGVERAYSIVSAPHEELLELFIERVPHGELTPRLWGVQVGDSVTIRPRAKGVFIFDEKHPNHLMLATVTGIAPFVSMTRSYLHQGRSGHHFYILQGASYFNEFVYREEMEHRAAEHSDAVTYVSSVSRPTEDVNRPWRGYLGRVNLLVEAVVGAWGLKPESTAVYACGHPGMIEDAKARLAPKGFVVKEERYWV